MNTILLRLRLAPRVPGRTWNPWPFGLKRSTEYRALQRRLAAARFGVESPRRRASQPPYEDLQ